MKRKVIDFSISRNNDAYIDEEDSISTKYESNKSEEFNKRKNIEKSIKPVKFTKLFLYTTSSDKICIIIGIVMAIGMGITWPLMFLYFGYTTDYLLNFQNYFNNSVAFLTSKNITVPSNASINDIVNLIRKINPKFLLPQNFQIFQMMLTMAQYFTGIAAGMFVLSFLSESCLLVASDRQIWSIRKAFYRALASRNNIWFDEQDRQMLKENIIEDMYIIRAAIGNVIGDFFVWISCSISGVILSFCINRQLTLVLMSVYPFQLAIVIILPMIKMRSQENVSDSYETAGDVAAEIFKAVKLIASFGSEKFEITRYIKSLNDVYKVSWKNNISIGLLQDVLIFLTFILFSLGFWYGGLLVYNGQITVGQMITIFFCCTMASMAFEQIMYQFASIWKARISFSRILEIIHNDQEYYNLANTGTTIKDVKGKISFRNVNFKYDGNANQYILKNLSFNIKAGEKVALVGTNGCGKSSVLELIHRNYDSFTGEIFIDDVNIKDLHLKSYQQQVGVVLENPILFNTTIRENIRYGRGNVSDEEIDWVVEATNATKFIEKLPNKLDTLLTSNGDELDVNQRQVISIARCLVQKPKIVLLDEATSNINTMDRQHLENVLENTCLGHTTIFISHDLHLIQSADVILVLNDGNVIEVGKHDELSKKRGFYQDLLDRKIIFSTEKEDMFCDEDERKTISHHETNKKLIGTFGKFKIFVHAYVLRAVKLNWTEKWYLIGGGVMCFVSTASHPGTFIGYLIPLMSNPNLTQQQSDVQSYSIIMAAIAFLFAISFGIQVWCFSTSDEKLTLECRKRTLLSILRQDMAWFDNPVNNNDALSTRLSDEVLYIRMFSSGIVTTCLQFVAGIGGAILISMIYSWYTSIVMSVYIPVIIVGVLLQRTIINGLTASERTMAKELDKLLLEFVEKYTTVANLNLQSRFVGRYEDGVQMLSCNTIKKSVVKALVSALTHSAVFCSFASTFTFAGYLVQNNTEQIANIYIAFGCAIFVIMYLQYFIKQAPSMGKAKRAASNMFSLLDCVPEIDNYSEEGAVIDLETARGGITFESVQFRDCTARRNRILEDVNFKIEPKTFAALIDLTGTSKRIIGSLIQRLNECSKGKIYIDDTDICDLNVKSLRSLSDAISNELTFFSYSIRENIAYGVENNEYSDQEIINAAKAANIHDFISKLPEKYGTLMDCKRCHFTTSQKLRISIARTILRNPKIILVDKTWVLSDREGNLLVNDAISNARKGRTCILFTDDSESHENAEKIILLKGRTIANE